MIIKLQNLKPFRYQDTEKSDGWVLTKVLSTPYAKANKLPMDIFDSVHNPGEAGAVFLPTRVLVTRGQANTDTDSDADYCMSPLHKCESAADCDIGNDALQKGDVCENGFCKRRQW